MSGTSAQRLQQIKGQLDTLFANAHRDDKPELIADLRGYLSQHNSALRAPQYDAKHQNAATVPGRSEARHAKA
jgi:hypothetical protein